MMPQEFTALTGIDPTAGEYGIIEQMYYDFDGDKRAFCKDFTDRGLIADVRRKIDADHAEELRQCYLTISRQEHEIVKLKARLEKELEWQPYVSSKLLRQERYDELVKSGGSREMNDDEAKQWIFEEFGFAPDMIRINRKMNVQEKNRHGFIRKVGEIDRSPYYNATDWYYVFFTVCGMEYEACNGSLTQL